MDQYLRLLWLIPLGFFAGGYGTLIGAGGGFVLAPALLLLYPGEAPETITSISLASVFLTRSQVRSPTPNQNVSITSLDLFSRSLACRELSSERWRQLP